MNTNRKRWPKGTYMRITNLEHFRNFIVMKEDVEALRAGKSIPKHKMPQRKLADSARVDPSFINHLSSGRRKSCSPAVAMRICEALNLPLSLLFDPIQVIDGEKKQDAKKATKATAERKAA